MILTKKYFLLLLGAVFLLAFLIRFAPFFHGDFFFFQDQSRDLLLVKEIVENGKIILIGSRTGFGGLFHGPAWIYSLIPTYLISGGNPYWTLVPTFLFHSLGIVIAGFVVGWKLYGKWVGLIFSFFLSISSSLIAAIYYMTDAHVMPLVFVLYLYFTLNYLRGSQKSLVASAFLIGIGFQYESAFSVLLIPTTALAILISRKLSLKTFAFSLLALIVSVSNFLIFDLRHNFLMTESFVRLIKRGGAMAGYENYQNISFRVFDRFAGSINSFFSSLYSKDLGSEALLIIIIFSAIYMIVKKIRQKEKLNQTEREFLFLLFFPFIVFSLYVLYPYPLWSHYILPISVVSALLLSLSISKIGKNKIGLFLGILLVILASAPILNSLFITYFRSSNQPIPSDSSYKNQLSVANWVLKDSGGKHFNYLVYIPSTFTYGMDYLFSWKSLVDGHEISPCQKKGLTYLIYYPHFEGDNKAFSFWKENIIKTKEKPLVSKKFVGDILVEKLNIMEEEKPIDPNYCQNLSFR